ncbi:hypothetical protein [Bacillus toyonensis]|uniref:Lipoprotein n=1 Tax=Bacillus toyonensis TaxID=155322 RepID=A0A2B5X6W6_9BACI|nr:hypothetical protein [Bacillus toyonensis]PGA92080.1 hypothetical protein COL93_26835 [Bacillus toyonensis]PHD65146.1 hypothetical protein COF40_23270 [Bacillus toyonensis]
MKGKLLAVALPVMLIGGVGCASKDVTEEKKEDNVKSADYKKVEKETNKDAKASDSESGTTNKDPIASVIKEVDNIHEEKDKLEQQKEVETKKEEIAKEKEKVSNATKPNSMKEYQEKVDIQAKKFAAAIQATKPIVEKDKTLQTNKDELKAQFDVVKGEAQKLIDIKPPEQYSYFTDEFIDANKMYLRPLDDLFSALDERDEEKGNAALMGVLEGLDQFAMTLNETRKIEE